MAITLTESAAGRIKGYLQSREGVVGLRLGVTRTGCSGFAYVVDFAAEIGSDDVVFDSRGVKVVVDPDSLKYVNGMEVDFGQEGLNQSFMFNNPNVTAACGCGESFTI